MGTNIYARVNPPKAEREKFVLKVKEIVDSDELFMFSKLNDLLQEYKEEYPEVHLGKQVFGDEKDRAITDKILKDVEKVVNGVAEAMPHIESTAIANLPREPLPENNENDAELQRRQEVVELAESLLSLPVNTLKKRTIQLALFQ